MSLDDDTKRLTLDKMSVLVQPPRDNYGETDFNELAKFLDTRPDYLPILIDELANKELFNENTKWFRHELIQKCLEDRLSSYRQYYVSYHTKAAKLYQSLYSEIENNNMT
jgi:hypothetical protein